MMALKTGKKTSRFAWLLILVAFILILLLLLRSCGRHQTAKAPAPAVKAPDKAATEPVASTPETEEPAPEEAPEPEEVIPEEEQAETEPPAESPAPEPVAAEQPVPEPEVETEPAPMQETQAVAENEPEDINPPVLQEQAAEAVPEEPAPAPARKYDQQVNPNWQPQPVKLDAEDEKLWAQARRTNTEEAYRGYLERFPNGRHEKEANEILRSGMYPVGRNPQGYEEFRHKKTDSLFVLIPAGEFWMGSPKGEGEPDEHPRHKVYLDAYYIGKYEVTIAEYEKFCESTGHKVPQKPWLTEEGKHPYIYPTWEDAHAYCEWAGLRLPTEAQWEKAARGNTETTYYWGDNPPRSMANFLGTGGKDKYDITSPVGSFPPNGYGVYDTAGNIWEWCADWYDPDYYTPKLDQDGVAKNPKGPRKGKFRVIRGGSWNYEATKMRPAFRTRLEPKHWYDYNGFRTAESYMPE